MDNSPTFDSHNCADESGKDSIRSLEDTIWYHTRSLLRKNVLDDWTHSVHPWSKQEKFNGAIQEASTQVNVQAGQEDQAASEQCGTVWAAVCCYAELEIRRNYLRTKYSPYSFRPSLSDFGKLHVSDAKSDLLQCLEQPEQSQPPSTNDCEILDGAVVIHCLPTSSVNSLTHSLLRLTSWGS